MVQIDCRRHTALKSKGDVCGMRRAPRIMLTHARPQSQLDICVENWDKSRFQTLSWIIDFCMTPLPEVHATLCNKPCVILSTKHIPHVHLSPMLHIACHIFPTPRQLPACQPPTSRGNPHRRQLNRSIQRYGGSMVEDDDRIKWDENWVGLITGKEWLCEVNGVRNTNGVMSKETLTAKAGTQKVYIGIRETNETRESQGTKRSEIQETKRENTRRVRYVPV